MDRNLFFRWADSVELFVYEALNAEPSNQQLAVLRDIDAGVKDIAIKSGHGCFGIDTEIMMIDGSVKKVQDVSVGDVLMGDDGSKRNVLELYRGRENMYRFTYMDGTSHVFNESHILCLVATQTHGRQKTGDKINVTVREWLTWSDRRKRTHAIYRNDVYLFMNGSTVKDPYLLGVWLGDGTRGKPTLTLNSEDMDEILDGYTVLSKREECGCFSVLVEEAKSLYMDEKRIPHHYLTASRADRMQLLAGLMDTDGYFDPRGYCYEIVQKSKELADGIVFLARSLGMHATIKEVEKTCTNTGVAGTYHLVNISRNVEMIPCRVSRKLANQDRKKQRPNLYFGIRTVEPLGEGDYYGFELDGNHKFLGGDFTVLHNTGKTGLLSWVILWAGLFHFDTKIPATAPTAPQLLRLLIPEVRKWRENLPAELKDAITVNNDQIKFETKNFCAPRTARKEAPEGLQGFHAEFLVWIVDEASGIDNVIFEVIDGSLTGDRHLRIMAANPTRTEGYFFDAFHKNRALWRLHTFNAEESSNVSKDSIERKRLQYGRDSDAYRVRVLGQFPKSNSDAVIPLHLIDTAVGRDEFNDYGAEVWGVDYADAGDDKTIMVKRIGNYFYEIVECPVEGSHRQVQTANWIAAQYAQTPTKRKPKAIFIDAIGEGSGLVSAMKQPHYSNIPVVAVKVSEAADDSEVYENKRAELYYRLKAALEDEGRMVNDDLLVGELSAQRFEITTRGRIKLVDKKLIKEALGRSPDRADAMALTCARVIVTDEEVDRIHIRGYEESGYYNDDNGGVAW